MSSILEGATTRPVTFCWNGQTRTMPAGTTVNVTEKRGHLHISIPGTLFRQHVHADTIEVP